MTKLIKELDKMAKCPSCKASIICRDKITNSGPVLQWQNQNGQSHYLPPKDDPDNPGNKIFGGCRPAGEQNQSTTPQTAGKTIWDIIDTKSSDMIELQTGSNVMRALAYENTKNSYPDMDDQSQIFGTIVNAEKGHLIQMRLIKQIKDWEKSAKL